MKNTPLRPERLVFPAPAGINRLSTPIDVVGIGVPRASGDKPIWKNARAN
ncbi:hypothetical protein IGE28_003000 [Salmonella enterica]|nr:hypothetical protein [Salmonella enterica]EGI3723404.1 hypothetical protein [Salmonella enterica]